MMPKPPPGFVPMTLAQAPSPPPPPGFEPVEMSWSDVGSSAFKNAPASAYRLGENIVSAVTNPVETVKGLYDVGRGVASKAAGAVGFNQDPDEKARTEAAANAVGEFFANRYGGMEEFKRTLAEDPVGFAADLSVVLTGGGALAARAGGVTGQIGNAVRAAGSAIDPIANAGRAVGAAARGTGKVASAALGMTSGVGATPINRAFEAGRQGNQAFTANMRGTAPMEDVISMGRSAVGEMRKDRSAAYKADIGKTFSSGAPLNVYPVVKSIRDTDKSLRMAQFSKDPAAAAALKDVRLAVAEWRKTGGKFYNTAEGFDALKQRIGYIKDKLPYGSNERRVVDNVYNTIRGEIVKQSPDYAKTMQDYTHASDMISEMERTLSLGKKPAQDTTLRKLQSSQRNNVNTNFGRREKLVDELARYEPDLPYALAGQALNSATPRGLQAVAASGAGLSAITNPATLLAMPAFSPRVVGEAAYAAGRAADGVSRATSYIPEDALIAALRTANQAGQATTPLRGGTGPRYDENGNLRR